MSSKAPRIITVIAIIAAAAIAIVLASPALSSFGAPVLVRQDVQDLTPAQKKAFVDALLKAKRTPSPFNPGISYYDQFVQWHKDAFRCDIAWKQENNFAGAAHNSPTFLPWHREFLHKFDEMLQQMSGDPTMTTPYWDWTDPKSTAAVFSPDFMGGNGNAAQGWAVTDGPLRKGKWRITIQDPPEILNGSAPPTPYLRRNFASMPAGKSALPTKSQVRWTLDRHAYDHTPFDGSSPAKDSFRNSLEGWRGALPATCDSGWVDQSEENGAPHVMHNIVHVYVGGVWIADGKPNEGTMAQNTSPNDPVFFIHHANVDRIWAAWELKQGGHYRPRTGAAYGWNATDTMWPWYDRTINSWFGTERNGYRYASLPRS